MPQHVICSDNRISCRLDDNIDPSCLTSASTLSPTWVLPSLQRLIQGTAPYCSGLPMDIGQIGFGLLRIEIGNTDHMYPGSRIACERNIDPNFPAPITPTRMGLSASSRTRSWACSDMNEPLKRRNSLPGHKRRLRLIKQHKPALYRIKPGSRWSAYISTGIR